MKVEKSPIRLKRSISDIEPSSPKRELLIKKEPSIPKLNDKKAFYTTFDTPSISRSSSLQSDKRTKWTKEHWKKLEEYYIKNERDYLKAGNEFYLAEGHIEDREIWPKDHIIWRCRCLDTNIRSHGGLLPSERKKRKVVAYDIKKEST